MTPHRHFVTHSDHRYLPKALTLHASLQEHHPAFTLWIVCTSPEAEAAVRSRDDATLRPVALREIEEALPALLTARQNRSLVEYYYTLSPAIIRYVLERPERPDMVTYLDADMMFFDSPERVFEELESASIGITPHRFSRALGHARRVGTYNVGWISFRGDARGTACLSWWFDQCIAWCYQRFEDGKYADQGYLDRFSELFDGVKILDDPGINLAPWNLANHRVTERQGRILVDGRPLVFFHFADLVQLSRWHYSTNTAAGLIWLTPRLRRLLFRPYIRRLRQFAPRRLPAGLRSRSVRDLAWLTSPRAVARSIRNFVFMQYVIVLGNHVF